MFCATPGVLLSFSIDDIDITRRKKNRVLVCPFLKGLRGALWVRLTYIIGVQCAF